LILDRPIQPAVLAPPAATSPETSSPVRETKRSFLVAALISNLVLWGSLATLKALAPKLGESLGVGALATGSLLFLALSAQGAGFFLLGNSKRWTYRVGTLLAAVPAALAGLALVYVAGAQSLGPVALGLVAAGAGAVVIGGAQAVTYTASVFYSLDYDTKRGLRTGIHEAVLALGGSLPIVGGALADASGNLQAPLLFMGAICVLGALAVGWNLRREFARSGRAS
jgi:MFS family permease